MAENVETAVYRLRVEGQAEIDRLTKSVEGLAVSEEKAASSTRTFSQALQNNVARIDPLVRAQEQYRKALETNLRYRETGVGTEAQLSAQLEGSTKRYQQQVSVINQVEKATVAHTNATKASRYELINLGRQFQDVGVSLAGGQSPFMVLIQQGSQIADVFASSERKMSDIFKSMGAGIVSFVTNPITLAITAVTALAAATLYAANNMDKLQVSSQRAISGAGARTGTTPEDINKFVAQTSGTGRGAGTTGLSDTEARQLAEGFTKSGEIVISQLHDMGTAVQGFANQTEKSVSEAVKAFVEFGKDPIKALQAFADAFGPLNDEQQKAFQNAVALGDKTAQLNVIMDAHAEALKKAAENTTWLERRWRDLATVFGRETQKPPGIDTQIENAKKQLDALIESAANVPPGLGAAMLAQDIGKATDALIKLREEKEKGAMQTLAAQMADVEAKARAATEALIPQIKTVRDLDIQINQLKEDIAKGGGDADTVAALQKAQNVRQATSQTADEQKRLNQYIAETVILYGNVTQATALQLRDLEAQLPVIQAVTGAEKMRAQSALDYANALKTLPPAAAQALAAAKYEASQVAATTSVKRQVESLKDSTAMIKAQENGTEATTAAAIAYKNAIESGASATSAAALYAATLENRMAGAAAQARQLAQAAEDAAVAESMVATKASLAEDAARRSRSLFEPVTMPTGALSFVADPTLTASYGQGTGKRLDVGYGTVGNLLLAQGQATVDPITGRLVGKQQDTTAADKLTSSLDDLKTSTDSLNATNQDLLSPYYTQDPRTSHIGFRSQGMALGGYVEVPGGYSSNDNMVATIPVASGERIYVDPMGDKRGISSGGSTVINISSPITINGNANADQFGRTVYQANQQLAKQVRSATQ